MSLPARSSPPAIVILGNDAMLAAAPATPVQLAHACLAYGFAFAVPASWGDELIAGETLRQLATRAGTPVIQCACPLVAARLLATGAELAPFLISLVAPPIAAARYVRAAYGTQPVRITYVGDCPVSGVGDASDAIDVVLAPGELLIKLAGRGIVPAEQPLVFDSVVPPDRRRFCSVPGGLPAAEVLWNDGAQRTVVEIDADDLTAELAQHLLAGEHTLLDLAPRLGCACSGAAPATARRGAARAGVSALEPPRALTPVIDPTVRVALHCALAAPAARDTGDTGDAIREAPPPADPASTSASPPPAAPAAPVPPGEVSPPNDCGEATVAEPAPSPSPSPSPSSGSEALHAAIEAPARRRTPAVAMPRIASGSFPRIGAGAPRALPRAYVGKRRVPPGAHGDATPHVAAAAPRLHEDDPAALAVATPPAGHPVIAPALEPPPAAEGDRTHALRQLRATMRGAEAERPRRAPSRPAPNDTPRRVAALLTAVAVLALAGVVGALIVW